MPGWVEMIVWAFEEVGERVRALMEVGGMLKGSERRAARTALPWRPVAPAMRKWVGGDIVALKQEDQFSLLSLIEGGRGVEVFEMVGVDIRLRV